MTRKSKDPKTAKSNQILRMRGLSVRDVVLPWDSKEEFERLHRELTAEFSPHGRMEEDIVLDMAILRWRKYQLAKWKRTAALKDPYFIELMESGKKSWSGIRKYLRGQEEDCKTVRGELMNVLSKLTDAATELARASKKGVEKEKLEHTEQEITGIMKALTEHVIPLLQAIDGVPSAEKTFEQAYLPESFERVLKCEAAIDSRIDKLLGRLVSLKEYKRVYGGDTLLLPNTKSPPTATEFAGLTAAR
jgi:hypothetical protein